MNRGTDHHSLMPPSIEAAFRYFRIAYVEKVRREDVAMIVGIRFGRDVIGVSIVAVSPVNMLMLKMFWSLNAGVLR